jgi:hypothetical protein
MTRIRLNRPISRTIPNKGHVPHRAAAGRSALAAVRTRELIVAYWNPYEAGNVAAWRSIEVYTVARRHVQSRLAVHDKGGAMRTPKRRRLGRLLLLGGVALLASPAMGVRASRPDVAWHEIARGGTVPDRALHTMIYDSAHQLFWAFGGVQAAYSSNQFRNTLFKLDATKPEALWQLVPISGLQPPPIEMHTAVYDDTRQRMIVYGGLTDRSGFTSQTVAPGTSVWLLDLKDAAKPSWSRVSVPGMPLDRFAHAAVYVPELDAMVVSGGAQTFSSFTNSNYALLLGKTPLQWIRLSNVGFNARAGHVLVYDAVGQRLVAYGGFNSFDPAATLSEAVWLDLSKGLDKAGDWHRLNTATPGLSRGFMAAAFDPERRLWWVQGGVQSDSTYLNDLSVLDLSVNPPTWTRTQVVHNGPLVRFAHVAAWDPVRDAAVFEGGTPDNQTTLGSTYQLAMVPGAVTPTATALPDTATPTPMATEPPTVTPSPTATELSTTTPPTPFGDTDTPTPTTEQPSATPSPSITPAAEWHVFLPWAEGPPPLRATG